jgi:hypothetical protein
VADEEEKAGTDWSEQEMQLIVAGHARKETGGFQRPSGKEKSPTLSCPRYGRPASGPASAFQVLSQSQGSTPSGGTAGRCPRLERRQTPSAGAGSRRIVIRVAALVQ